MAHSALPGPGVLAVPSHQRGTEIVNGKLFLISFQIKNIAALAEFDKGHNYSLTSLKPSRDVEKDLGQRHSFALSILLCPGASFLLSHRRGPAVVEGKPLNIFSDV